MQTTAKLKHLRISPRKTKLIVDAIRGLTVEQALHQLKFSGKRAAGPITKLINSSIANAEHNHQIAKDNLYIKEIRADQGPVLKRWRARAFGRASGIKKRTSHISLILSEIKPTAEKKDKKSDKKINEAKVVKSLDEIKEKTENIAQEDKDKQGDKDKSQVEKTKGPKSTKRRFFSRKSG